MTKPLNPEKAKKLRPLRICLAILIAILLVIILDRVPTSVKDRQSNQEQVEDGPKAPEGYKYYYLFSFYDILESQTKEKLDKLGVSKDEYENLAEYLSQDELFELSAKAALALSIENTFVEANEQELEELKKIFNLSENYSFADFKQQETAPTDYKILSDLISEYYKSLKGDE